MTDYTTRLVTLEPPDPAAWDSVLDAVHAAASATTPSSYIVGRAAANPVLPGQPPGAHALVDLTTEAPAADVHDLFIDTARQALLTARVPYAWWRAGCLWQYGPGGM